MRRWTGGTSGPGTFAPWRRRDAAAPALVPGHASRATKVAAGLLAVAVVLALVVLTTTSSHPTSSGPQASGSSHTVEHVTGTPATTGSTVPLVVPPLPTVTATTPTTAARATATGASTGTHPAGLCTPQDVVVTASTGAPAYPAGAAVSATTTLTVLVSCQFTPVTVGTHHCAATLTFDDGQGAQVYPAPGQDVQCASLPSGVLNAGTRATVSLQWPQAQGGTYTAVASWTFSSGAQAASESRAASPAFTVS
ncbi:MAG TPA: hypothetical protein VEI83_14685 [Acidimicrobiales bacterium]|nr:hypothetical protein [Acidimicrobiales bacterium]